VQTNQEKPDKAPDLPHGRIPTGWMHFAIDKYQRTELRTSCSVEEEIFGALNFYCDVEDAGREYVGKNTGLKDSKCDNAYRLFQAFVRQGQTFYSSASKLHHRASPLFYYYAFLNLAKAYISLRTPEVFLFRLRHGLVHRYDPNAAFASQSVDITSRGVFPQLYQLLTKTSLPKPCSFNVLNLLGYITDIGFEYEDAGFGIPYILPVKLRLLVKQIDDESCEGWTVVAVGEKEKSERRSYAFATFLEYFEEVQFSKSDSERMFQLLAGERLMYRFFQTKKVYKAKNKGDSFADLRSDTRKAVDLLFMPNVFRDDSDFLLSIPTENKPALTMDEFLAGYLIFFYLGSLVRYHPDYLERILRSKEAWIIQRFTTSCATTLLRHASTFLLGQNRIFCSR
jgi:hypothetical protein